MKPKAARCSSYWLLKRYIRRNCKTYGSLQRRIWLRDIFPSSHPFSTTDEYFPSWMDWTIMHDYFKRAKKGKILTSNASRHFVVILLIRGGRLSIQRQSRDTDVETCEMLFYPASFAFVFRGRQKKRTGNKFNRFGTVMENEVIVIICWCESGRNGNNNKQVFFGLNSTFKLSSAIWLSTWHFFFSVFKLPLKLFFCFPLGYFDD